MCNYFLNSVVFVFIHHSLFTLLFTFCLSSADFSLMCNRGYRITSIRRVNSVHQRKGTILGSLAIECQPIVPLGNALPNKVKCGALETAPQCNGWVEGCSEQQWLGGFNAFVMDNATNAILLDPICCESADIIVEELSCAKERLNSALMPFEHTIATDDFIYRGLHCWHQYDQSGASVDLVWKMEICQYRVNNSKRAVGPPGAAAVLAPPSPHPPPSSSPMASLTSAFYRSCPPCECHCGIGVCGNGVEPVRVTHKILSQKCVCNCACRYECV